MLLICTFTPLNTRRVFQLVFPSFCNALRAHFISGNLKLNSINPFNSYNEAVNHRWTILTLFGVYVIFP